MKKLVIVNLRLKVFFFILCSLLFFSACSSAPIITATDLPISTYVPSYTSTPTKAIPPTLTPTLTTTPMPTSTPTSIPLLISKAGRVVRSVQFDSLSTLNFSVDTAGNYEVKDGLLILTDPISTTGNPWGDGHVALRSIFSPQVGHVSLFVFRVEPNTYFGYHYELYENTAGHPYRGVNLDCCLPGLVLNIDQGNDSGHPTQTSMPVSAFQFGVWYVYALQAKEDGSFTAQIWERDTPNTLIFDRSFQLDETWIVPGFTFIVAVDQGKMEIDEYQELELNNNQ